MPGASTSSNSLDGAGRLELRDGPLQGDSARTVPVRTYDVFINHRGPDVKKTLVSHLCAALKRLNFSYFVDYEALRIGDLAKEEIKSAIQHSNVHLAVFTPDYADSEWCLDELYFIMESFRQKSTEFFLPVFFYVKPSDLRLLKPDRKSPLLKPDRESCYGLPLVECGKTIKDTVIEKWKNALHEAADVKGFIFPDDFQGFEANLVEGIVSKIFEVLTRSTLLHGPKHPVGVDKILGEALNRMKSGDSTIANVKMLGIYGMGGIGKTTLAKSIYNSTLREFESACFIQNVSESCRVKGLVGLQQDLLHKLLKTTEFSITGTAYGKQMMRERLRGRKVLIILDDVDEKKQLDELLPPHDCCLGKGSQIVVTTRDQQVCKWADAKTVFLADGLSRDLSRQLFNMHAFPPEGMPPPSVGVKIELAEKVADICQGLPLALEVLGSYLKDEDISTWKDTVKLLERNKMVVPMHKEVIENLKISFNPLCPAGQEMFLDIACFMLQEPRDKAMRIWKSDFGGEEAEHQLENLIRKCLVKVDTNGYLIMHDLLRDMGRQIVSESHKHYWEQSHLWREEEVKSILNKRKGKNSMSHLRGLSSSVEKEWNTSAFSDMDELKLLVLNRVTLTGEFSKFSDKLRWLQLRKCMCDQISSWLQYLDNLAVLDLEGSQLISFSCGDNLLQNLTELSLRDCSNLVEFIIDFRRSSKRLEVLQLSGCVNLEQIPESVAELSSSLTYLDVSRCSKLTTLPEGIANLTALDKIGLHGMVNLVSLPRSMDRLSKLKALNLEGCSNLCEIRRLPSSLTSMAVGGCTGLKHLDMFRLSAFPDGMESLCNLLHLSYGGSSISTFTVHTEVLSKLTSLKTLLDSAEGIKYVSGDKREQWDYEILVSQEEHMRAIDSYLFASLENVMGTEERWVEVQTMVPASFHVDKCTQVVCGLPMAYVTSPGDVKLRVMFEGCQTFSQDLTIWGPCSYFGIFRPPHPLISSLRGGALIEVWYGNAFLMGEPPGYIKIICGEREYG